MPKTRHNVFISYYHQQDQHYKDKFVRMMGANIIDKSVRFGEIIDQSQPSEAVFQRIREDYIAQVSVTVVLVGRCTWKRKYIDWEIGASLRDTKSNPRCGLLAILLPTHPDFGEEAYSSRLLPPRLADNRAGDKAFATVDDWTEDVQTVRRWIHQAFSRRREQPGPDISRLPFARNWNGTCSEGRQG